MSRKSIYLEDFQVGVTHESPPHVVTEQEIVEFAQRYDPQPFHLDAEAAKDSVFGGMVCAGFQTASLTWALAQRTGMFLDCALAGMGLDEVRWLAPVRPGDVLRCRFTPLEWRYSASRPDAGVMRARYDLANQDGRTVITMVMIQLVRRRPAPVV